MFRITNRMMYNRALYNAFRNNEGLLAAQEQLSSGKRINKPSDDPIGMMSVLDFRTDIGKNEQYLRVMNHADTNLSAADSTLGQIHDGLKDAKSLAIQASNGTIDATNRDVMARKIDNMIEQMVQYGNTKVGRNYIFGGADTSTEAVGQNGEYIGSSKDFQLEITEGTQIPVSARADQFLTGDMNPALSPTTTLASLNGGTGVTAGTFTITDRAGTTTPAIDTTAMTTVGEVLAAINGAGTNITASISADGTAIVLADSTAAPLGPISVLDGGLGTAQALGIDGVRNTSNYVGTDLNPVAVGTTPLLDLFGGQGITLDPIRVSNGGVETTVTFGGETTINDVLTTINTAVPSVTAAINAAGTRIDITSNDPATVAVTTDVGTGRTADLLGMGGGRNIIPTLKIFSAALKADDTNAILGSIGLLDSVMTQTSAVRGEVGALANRVTQTQTAEDQSKFDSTKAMSYIEDADYLQAASELAMLSTAYQATLKSSALIIQPTLMDFIG